VQRDIDDTLSTLTMQEDTGNSTSTEQPWGPDAEADPRR